MLTFQQIILKLQAYWDAQGCALLQPYDMEVGAGTFHQAVQLGRQRGGVDVIAGQLIQSLHQCLVG